MSPSDNETQMEEEQAIKEKPLHKLMVLACYSTALCLVISIVYGFTGIAADIINKTTKYQIDRFQILSFVSIFYLMWRLMINLGNFWRSNEKNEIGTAVTNFPNPFYDPSFTKGPLVLRMKYRELLTQYRFNRSLLKKGQETAAKLGVAIQEIESKLRVLLRHNDNSNRLIRSFNYLLWTGDEHLVHKILSQILAECITVLEKDQSDKSISLFQVKEGKLFIKESVRINAESVAKRSFSKGIGFAGYIWSIRKAEIVNHIEKNDERFIEGGLPATPIGSILGFPLIVEEEILGVLCMQSESENGFSAADLRTVEFYARMCTLILLYDIINKRDFNVKGGGNIGNVETTN